MPSPAAKFRLGLVLGLLVCAGAAVAAARWAVLPWALGAALRAGGASNVTFDLTRASPWRLQVDDLAFDLEAARIAAASVSLDRAHWWAPSLGRLKMHTARVELALDRLDGGGGTPAAPAAPASPPRNIPLEEISVDGQLTLRAGDETTDALTLRFAARPGQDGKWQGQAQVEAPGLQLAIDADYSPGEAAGSLRTSALRLDLRPWQAWTRRLVPLPGEPWIVAGTITGNLAGSYRAGNISGTGDIQLSDAAVASPGLGLAAEGIGLSAHFGTKPGDDCKWQGHAKVTGPGLELAVEATHDVGREETEFRTTALRADLRPWQAWIEHLAELPDGPWELAGEVIGVATGAYRAEELIAQGEFRLRDARVANTSYELVADGIEADLPDVNLATGVARNIAVRARQVTVAKIAAADVTAGIASATEDQIEVSAFSARALGGMVRLEPFTHRLDDPAVEVVVAAENIRAEHLMALTEDLPARASGPLSGRLPVRYDGSGLRLGTGWLGLAAGGDLELQFQSAGLLTAGTSPKSANYAVLKRVEDGLLKLKVTELRLDVRPAGAPASRTAQLRIVGAPVDPQVKAPVTFDLNVNGPVESLLNLGLKTGNK
jgi:hypothetical protein